MSRSRGPLPLLLTLSAATFTSVGVEMMPTGVLDALASSLDVPTATAGLLVSVRAGTIAVTSLPLVRATLRYRRKSVIIAALSVLAVATAAMAGAPTYPIALAARVTGAAAHGVFWAVVVAYAASVVPPERVGRALAIVLAGPTLASLVALPLGALAAQQVGWRTTFLGLSVACAVCVALVGVMAPGAEPSRPTGSGGHWDRTAPTVLRVAGAGVFALIGFSALFTFVVPVSGAVAAVPPAQVPGILLASGLGGLLGVLAAGRISDRWPAGALPAIAALLTVTLAATGVAHSPALFLAAAVAWGVLIGILPVVLQAAVMRAASAGFQPIAGSVLVTLLNLGVALGALLGSAVIAAGALDALPFVAAATAALAPVSLVLSRRGSEHRCRNIR